MKFSSEISRVVITQVIHQKSSVKIRVRKQILAKFYGNWYSLHLMKFPELN